MRFAKVLLCVALSGCGPMAWKTLVETGAPQIFGWQGTTVWGYGSDTVLRRAEGSAWERVELCAPYDMSTTFRDTKLPVQLAFEGPAVWAMCGSSPNDAQTLLRHDGSGTAVVVEMPFDGTLQLVPMLDGPPTLLGSRAMYQWNGTGWDNKGDHLLAPRPSELGRGAGLSASEIYVEVNTSVKTMMWWNGMRWQSMLGDSSGPPTLRLGKAWSGLQSLEGGYYNPVAIKGEKALKEKGLTLASLLTLDTLLAVGGNGTQYYSLGVADTEPVSMGVAPMGDRSGQAGDVTVVDVYGNVGTILSRGDNGSGVSFVYGVDRNTVLIGSTTGGGLGGGSAFTTLIQGSR